MAFLDTPILLDEIPADESRDFEPIPTGTYTATVASIELRSTKAGTGQYLAVRLDVTGPTHEGRVLWTNLNIRNPNPKAEEIALQQLSAIMRAARVDSLQDTDQLIGASVGVKVSISDDATYGRRNEVKGITAAAGGPARSAPPMPAAAPAASTPPWQR